MTFLAPTAGLIAAAAALPALLVLYLLKLRRRPVRVSSTLLWVQATSDLQVNVPFRWIRPTLMLLLHLLILSMLLLALARPAVNMDAAPAAKVVLLIDRSASMSAVDEPGGAMRLDQAKERALRVIDTLGRSGRAAAVAVVAFGSDARALTTFSQDRGAARAAVESVEPGDQPADFESALRLAGAMLAGETSEESQGDGGLVILLSDGAFAHGRGFALAGADFRYERVGPRPGPEEAAGPRMHNVGIVALAARRDWDDPGLVRVFARLQNSGPLEAAMSVVLRFDGEEVQRRAVTIPGAAAAQPQDDGGEALPPEPGQASVTFELATREAGVATVALSTEDALSSDNTASVVLRAATKPRVLLVVPDAAIEAGGRDPAWLLTSVLEEMQVPFRRQPASAFAADMQSGAALRADLVIFDRVAPEAVPPLPSLSFGAGLPDAALGGVLPEGTYVLTWDRSHPLLRHVSLDTVYVAQPRAVQAAGEIEALARGRDAPLIVLSDPGGLRRVVVSFELAQSNWPAHFGFPIFLASAIDFLTLRGDDVAAQSFTTAEPVRLTLLGPGRLLVQGPRSMSVDVPRPREEGAPVTVSLGVLDRAGVYRLGGEVPGAPPAAAVNLLNEQESAIYPAERISVAGESVSASTADDGPREVWHWFVLAALLLLAVEWFVGAWMMRA